MDQSPQITRRAVLKTAAVAAAATAVTGVTMGSTSTGVSWTAINNDSNKDYNERIRLMDPNSEFYNSSGVFNKKRALEAYYAMMERFSYPIPAVLRSDEFWTSDFAQGDFVNVGMAGIFWVNDKVYRYFAHEIFLLPGQMIVEHKHNVCDEGPPKMESWHVRHGEIHTFGEGEATADLPCHLPRSQLDAGAITVRYCKTLQAGEIASLNRITAPHFMIAGSAGAIVTEYGTTHYDEALEFTNKTVVF